MTFFLSIKYMSVCQSRHIYNYYNRFVFQRKSGASVNWWCSVRNKISSCPATVRQRGEEFVEGRMGHTHTAEPGVATKLQITAKVGVY